ncbi:unnamed protein product [Cunninghamella blakesleeana]
MNSSPNTNKNTNAKSTPPPVFNYAQVTKGNTQNLEQNNKPKQSGQNNKPQSQTFKQQSNDDNGSKGNKNTSMNGLRNTTKPNTQSKPTFAAVANASSKQNQQTNRSASVQLPRAPPAVDKSSIQFGSINQATETVNQTTTTTTSNTTTTNTSAVETVVKSEVTFGSLSSSDKTTNQPQSPQLSQSQNPTTHSQNRRDSTQSNHSVGEHNPHHQNNSNNNNNNNNNNRHYNSPRPYNQSKHINASYSPNMSNTQQYIPHHHGKKSSPHMPSSSPSSQNVTINQYNHGPPMAPYQFVPPHQPYNSQTQPYNAQAQPYSAQPQQFNAQTQQYYPYGQMPIQTFTPNTRQGNQQTFISQPPPRSRAIPIIDPNTGATVSADTPTAGPAASKNAKSSDKKDKDIKFPASPSTTKTVNIVDPAVKEREERDRQEKEEAERLAKEKAEKEEAERLAKEKAEKEEAERLAKEKAEKEEAERLAKEKAEKEEAERLAKEKAEKEEAERLAKEKAEKEEAERLAKEKAEKEEAERLAKEKAEKEEAERIAKEKAEKEEAERIAKEKAEKEEAERIAKEKAEKEKADRVVKEKAQKEEAERKERDAAVTAAVAEAERKEMEKQRRAFDTKQKEIDEETQRIKKSIASEKKTSNGDKVAKPSPGRIEISSIPSHVLENEPQAQSPGSLTPTSATPPTPAKKIEIPRQKISDFEAIQYPEGISKTPSNPTSGKIQYDPEFLMQFKPLCLESKEDLSAFQNIGDESNERSSSKGGMQRRQTSERGNRGPRTPTGDNVYRHGSRDGRMESMGKFTGGRPLAAHRTNSSGTPPPGGIQRDGSHSGRSRSGRGSGKGRHPPREQQGGPTIPMDQVVPLEKSENRWMPTVVAASGDSKAAAPKDESDLISQEVIIRKVKSLLNKLTLEKFDSISDQIWGYAHQSAKEENGESLLTVIQLIFDKACDEPPFAGMWAQLCRKLHDTMVETNDITDVNNQFDKHGKPIQSGHLFRKYLFNRCQQAFERGWKFDVIELEKSATGEVMMTDEYYAAVKAKRQGLGLVQFIGELFKRGMLTERIMTECLTRLCRNPQEAEDEETETMCKLVTTVGKELDHRKTMKSWMDAFFERMREMLECKTLSSRVKFMIMDVLELRKVKWVPRSIAQTGPTTIAQIREEAQRAKSEEKESIKRTSSSRGNTPQVMSRQGSRAGRNIQREGSTNSNAGATVTADGWSTVGNAASTTISKGRTNELANFGKADRSKSRSSVLGPSNSPFASLSRSGSKNANADSKRGSPADSRSSSPASSMSNMFSALGGDSADEPAETKPVERRKLNLLPRGSTLASDDQSATEESENISTATEESAKPKLTPQQIEQKSKDIIEEFILIRDAKELSQCIKELDEPVAFINKLLSVVEKKEDDVKGACEIINILSKDGLLEKEHYVEALKPYMEMYEDLTIDVPQAPKYVSQLLVAMDVDPSEVMEIEEPYDSGYVPASAKLKELYDAAKSSA